MKIKAKTYKQDEDTGTLYKIGEGHCEVYVPRSSKKSKKLIEEYVSLNFGKFRVHLDRKDFSNLCQQFNLLYNK
jgi:hypothetical protein